MNLGEVRTGERGSYNVLTELPRNCKELPGGPPDWEPEHWAVLEVLIKNNGYNYACNIRTDTFAQPRDGMPPPIRETNSCDEMRDNLEGKDGLTYIGKNRDDWRQCGPECHPVALFVKRGPDPDLWDFHFFRLDSDGTWSHKPGYTFPTKLGEDGRIIHNPIDSGWLGYEFYGYYCVCKCRVHLEPDK